MVKYTFDTRNTNNSPIIAFRLNLKEYHALIRYCNKKKITVSRTIRYCLMKEKIIGSA